VAKRRLSGIVLAVALVGGAAAFLLYRRAGDLTPAEAHRLVEGGALLVDVRSPSEFAEGHIAGALNIPVHEIEARAAELGPPERTKVLYCRSGNRSAAAAAVLEKAGHKSVHNLGAMSRW
jgi:rhodanese-related sulfurtransferase